MSLKTNVSMVQDAEKISISKSGVADKLLIRWKESIE